MEDVTEVEQFLDHPPFDEKEDNADDDDDDDQPPPPPCRAIVMAATYGEGEPTDNSSSIVQVIKELAEEEKVGEDADGVAVASASRPLADQLEFTVFGLGNRQYEHFNSMGKFFDKHLELMGGSRVYELGVGDDDADLEADFESWKDRLWTTLQAKYHVDSAIVAKDSSKGGSSTELKMPACEYEIDYVLDDDKNNGEAAAIGTTPLDCVHGSSKHYFTSFDCPVPVIRELRAPEDGGSTAHMEIDISKSKELHYETADNLGVLSVNDSAVVESVAKCLGYDLDQVFSLKAGPDHEWHGAPFPMPITVRECLTRYLDLTSAPRRSDLKQLIPYAKDVLDRKALTRLSSKDGKQEYKEKIVESYKGIADLLTLCPSLTIPLEHFISLCKFLLPRHYTISSSSSVHPDRIHLTVAVTEDTRKDGTKFHGVCSTHLASAKSVRVFVRPSTFRLPKDPSKPILMIGPGTGIAPMRALLQERRHQKLVQKKKVGKNILYFGCKKRALDYLYEDELANFEKEGDLDSLHVAFSRETKEKVYVQHLLAKHAKDTWKLLDLEGAYIYVCGGVKMGHDVTEALQEILSTEGQMSFPDAKDYLAKMASGGRFVQELWA
jgi:NADPH-ferrihemoprotein reductase